MPPTGRQLKQGLFVGHWRWWGLCILNYCWESLTSEPANLHWLCVHLHSNTAAFMH
jgi:hypothetical protein